uniref:Uncharacterized protein n=1 Tax=Nelumbo nucifera TaxID=4432 RepID=A0A822ZY05_NELNU|nr:TPA_asm: hypothetical protein HUJ06_016735 [Nelumbo nucifera]
MRRDFSRFFQPRCLIFLVVVAVVVFLAFPTSHQEEEKLEEIPAITHRVFLDVDIDDQRIGMKIPFC